MGDSSPKDSEVKKISILSFFFKFLNSGMYYTVLYR